MALNQYRLPFKKLRWLEDKHQSLTKNEIHIKMWIFIYNLIQPNLKSFLHNPI